jgi:hypothetical protein
LTTVDENLMENLLKMLLNADIKNYINRVFVTAFGGFLGEINQL